MKTAFIALLTISYVYAEIANNLNEDKVMRINSDDLEIQLLEEKIQNLKEKLSILEQLKNL